MAEKTIQIDIVTPDKTVFSGGVVSFSAPSVDGYFEVLYNHTPLLAALKIGKIVITENSGEKKCFSISGGFTEVNNNNVIVLAETAESGEAIDVSRAQEAKERALKRLAGKSHDINMERAQAALLRALNRISVSEMK